MKKLLPIAIACLFAISLQAQTSTNTYTKPAPAAPTQATPAKQAAPMQPASKDCLMMKDNKMWVMKDGKTTAMTSDMTLSNGTKVMVDGSYMTKDGKKMML